MISGLKEGNNKEENEEVKESKVRERRKGGEKEIGKERLQERVDYFERNPECLQQHNQGKRKCLFVIMLHHFWEAYSLLSCMT